MSNMFPPSPPSVFQGGMAAPGPLPQFGPGDAGGPPPPAPSRNGDKGKVVLLLKTALASVNQAAILERDDADRAKLHKISAVISQQIGAEQSLRDDVAGVSSLARLIRKSGSSY